MSETGGEFQETSLERVWGGTEAKYLVTEPDGKSYIERKYNPEVPLIWQTMKDVGLPVPDEMIVDPLQRFIRFPNVKADGSEVYGKSLASYLQSPTFLPRALPHPEIDPLFVSVYEHHLDEIKDKVTAYKKVADEHFIQLPKDDQFEVQVHPDGSWNLIILDLGAAKMGEAKVPHDYVDRMMANSQYSQRLFKRLAEIYTALKQTS